MKYYRAIIAIDTILGEAHILEWLGDVPGSIKEIEANEQLITEEDFNIPAGIYVARLLLQGSGTTIEETEWIIETNVSDRITWNNLK